MRPLRLTLVVIAVFQLVLGALFLVVPGGAADLFGLTPAAPPWVQWLFAMMAARFLGYAYGMVVAARDPLRNASWITSMIGIQAIDWTATLLVLSRGVLTLGQVTTAAFVPALFIAALLWWHPRRLSRREQAPHQLPPAAQVPA